MSGPILNPILLKDIDEEYRQIVEIVNQIYVNGFTWERRENSKTIRWNCLSTNVEEQQIYICYLNSSDKWYCHANCYHKPTISLQVPEIELLFNNTKRG